jgi:hypothetical protein
MMIMINPQTTVTMVFTNPISNEPNSWWVVLSITKLKNMLIANMISKERVPHTK